MSGDGGYFRLSEDAEIDPEAEPAFLTVLQDVMGLEPHPGVTLRPVFGKGMTVSFVYMEPHSVAPVHQHPQEQIGTVIEGTYEFELGGTKRWVRRGDVYIVPPNVPHGAVTGDESCVALDVFCPPREGFRELIEKAARERGTH